MSEKYREHPPKGERGMRAKDQLNNLMDIIIDDIIDASDEEILQEVKDNHGDPEHVANVMRGLIKKAKEEVNHGKPDPNFVPEG